MAELIIISILILCIIVLLAFLYKINKFREHEEAIWSKEILKGKHYWKKYKNHETENKRYNKSTK